MGLLMTAIESLHTHTTLSDGKLSHRELFELAESLGISVLAYTDHDAVPSPTTVAELETFRGRKTKWTSKRTRARNMRNAYHWPFS